MRKLLVALMIVAFAATAFADVTLSGSYKARGNYMSNMANVDNSTDDKNAFYDHDLDIWLMANTDKDTYFKSKIELLDGQWKEDGSATKTGGEIQVERAWLGHNFGVAKLDVGMMDGGGWGYVFGNTVDAYYRVKGTIPAGPGNVIAIVQKNYENNSLGSANADVKDAEKDDSDSYLLGWSGKVAGFKVAPLLVYTMNGAVDTTDQDVDTTVTKAILAFGGNFGAVAFESEFAYHSTSTEGANDPKVFGAYVNVSSKMGPATVGFQTAYASVDEDNGNAAFSMGEDFDDQYFLVLGDYEAYATGLPGMWANTLFADYSVNEKANVYGSFSYLMSNYDSGALEDASAYEVDLGMTYKITSALKYGVDFGYAKMDLDTGTDPDANMILQHYLAISF